MQTTKVIDLDHALQEYIEKEATHYYGFITQHELCPRHECPLDLTPDYHIECGACTEEAISHTIRGA